MSTADLYLGGGCLPRVSAVGESLPVWDGTSDECPLIPESEWESQDSYRPYDDDAAYNAVSYNQGSYPSCCLAASANAIQRQAILTRHGIPELDFQAAWQTLSGGRGGVAIDTALAWLMSTGMAIKGTAVRVKILEAWDCPTYQAIASAILRGYSVNYGHMVPGGGHAECGCTLTKSGSTWMVDTRGSWGNYYSGSRFHLVDLKSDIGSGVRTFGAFAIREIDWVPGGMVDGGEV